MLYVTTRGNRDAFTAHRTLCTDTAPDGGFFIPMQFPRLSENELQRLLAHPYEEIVAHVLNVFFSSGLTKWDVSLCAGRNTARVLETNSKILIAELWHNPGESFDCVIQALFHRVFGGNANRKPSEWFIIAVKIAVLFGVYGELCRQGLWVYGDKLDLSVPADDFTYPIAAMYAIDMGLPLGMIVCNCIQTQEVWNLIHRGAANISAMQEQLKGGIERLVLLRLDDASMKRLHNGRSFSVGTESVENLRDGLFCVVSGSGRVSNALNSILSTSNRIVTPTTALCVAGLGDYRAKTGESRLTLILEQDSPVHFAVEIEKATGIPQKKLITDLRE